MTVHSVAYDFEKWVGRLAVIPLVVYALGTPLTLQLYGKVVLTADSFLPAEIACLLFCAALVIRYGFV